MMMRRATPDSEALASSEDERPWPAATSFGALPRKENGVPGLGGGIWAQTGGRSGSFGLTEAARRVAKRDVYLGAPMAHHRTGTSRSANTPSPAASSDEIAANTLPFAIPLQPTPKTGRSLSHSQGQREMPISSASHSQMSQSTAGMEQSGALPLGLLNEAEEADIDTENESEFGGMLTQTTSHGPMSSLQRTATLPAQYESGFLHGNGRRTQTFDDQGFLEHSLDRRFENAFGNLTLDQHPRTRQSQWQTSLGWDDLPNVNESRRHSLADIPTRRGSLSDQRIPSNYNEQLQLLRGNHQQDHDNDLAPSSDTFTLPEGYNVPYIQLEPHERTMQTISKPQFNMGMGMPVRPKRELYIVSFKCSRVDVFFLLEGTGLVVNEGDMVIVEADRGQDLGTVQNARVSQEEARTLLSKYGEEQYKWLMMFSHNNKRGAVNPNATVYGGNGNGNNGRAAPLSTRPPIRNNATNLKPKAIKRMAAPHEVRMLREKEGNEAKAKRTCQTKVYQHHLDMEILEAEFQWDWNKCVFYYYADHYVNFKDLVNDLYKVYKIRLWMSAVNPASFSQNAINQPPSGIGPGAMRPHHNRPSSSGEEYDNTYQMAYGADPDPYGAVPPYAINYNTYNPNYPAIPGIVNSFPQGPMSPGGMPTLYQQNTMGAPVNTYPQPGANTYPPPGSNTYPQSPMSPASPANHTPMPGQMGMGMGMGTGFGTQPTGVGAMRPIAPPFTYQPTGNTGPSRDTATSTSNTRTATHTNEDVSNTESVGGGVSLDPAVYNNPARAGHRNARWGPNVQGGDKGKGRQQ